MAEEFALQEVLGQRRAVDRHKGAVRAVAPGMQGTGEHFLARAGLAGNKHRGPRGSHLAGQGQHPADGGVAAHDAGTAACGHGGPPPAQRADRRSRRNGPGRTGHGRHLFKRKRFQPVILGSQLHITAGIVRRAPVRNHHHRRKIGVVGSHGQQVLHLKTGQRRPGKNNSRTGLAHKRRGTFQVFGNGHFKTRVAQLRKNAGNGMGGRKKKNTLGRHSFSLIRNRQPRQVHGARLVDASSSLAGHVEMN